MSSAEKDREVYQDEEDGMWYYTAPFDAEGSMDNLRGVSFSHGPYETESKAIEAMQLHGLEE